MNKTNYAIYCFLNHNGACSINVLDSTCLVRKQLSYRSFSRPVSMKWESIEIDEDYKHYYAIEYNKTIILDHEICCIIFNNKTANNTTESMIVVNK